MRSTLLLGLLLSVGVMPVWGQFERKYYVGERMETVRSNLAKYDWARQQRDSILAGADHWVKYDDEKLRTLVVPPEVPRCYQIHNFGCPVHGIRVHEKGLYKWGISFDNPYKIKCPVGGEEYPSNDFAAFLASGMKDRSLLFNAEHPDPKDPLHKQYVDDGWGWKKAGEQRKYWFVAYYAHWIMYPRMLSAIAMLGKAALLAEDEEQAKKYAHKCALLLWQFAEYYPDYDYDSQSREGEERGGGYHGKITNATWETTTPRKVAPAYDAIRPFLPEDKELQELTGQTAEEIDAHIRDRLVLETARLIVDQTPYICGNYGSHQRSAAILAAVLDEKEKHPTREEMIEYIVANPDPRYPWHLGLRDALLNMVYRDGMPPESVGYNYGWVSSLAEVAAELTNAGVNLFEEPRFRKFLTWAFDVMVAGEFVPPMGDTGNIFAKGSSLRPLVARLTLPHFYDPRMAAVVRSNPAANRDLFEKPIEELLAEMPEAEVEPSGLQSTLFPGYGLAYLQEGSAENRTASTLSYSSHPQHAHYDQLNIMLFSHGNALLTDIGYPEQTDPFNHKRYAFFNNTSAHNTVTVNARKQSRGPGKLYAYQPQGFAQVVDASCEGAYPRIVSLYRRAHMLVEVSPTQSYLFDAFYVRGGEEHDYVALGAPAEFSAQPPLGPVQEKGTLAGEDVALQEFYDDEKYAAKPLGTMSYGGYRGSGFQYFFNVRRAPLEGQAICEWRLKKPGEGKTQYPWEGIGLRAHLIGEGEEIIGCDAKPQKYKFLPDTIQFMMRRRTGEDLASNFVTVYEPYRYETFIREVAVVNMDPDDGEATAARVVLVNGQTHYVFHSMKPEQTYMLDGKVKVTGHAACLVLDGNGKPQRAMLLNGTELAVGDFALKSAGIRKTKIVSVDYEKGVIEIADPVLTDHFVPGQTAIVAPDGFADCLRTQAVIDATHFSVGDEDLRVGGGPAGELDVEQNRIVTRVSPWHIQEGMTVLNSLMQPQGRVADTKKLTLDREDRGPLKAEDFPAGPGDSQPRFYVVMAGPGDTILIPSLAILERD